MRARLPLRGLVVALALAGCNTILGSDDYVADGKSGAGGQVAAGCGVATPDSQLVRGCVLYAGCRAFPPTWSLSTCVSYARLLAHDDDTELKGVAYASTCADTYIFTGDGTYGGAACGSPGKWKCDDNKAIQCNVSPPVFYDCTNRIALCDATATDDLTKIPCVVPTHTCKGAADQGCEGDSVYTCVGGKAYGLDCSISGGQCSTDAGGVAGCYYKPTGCTDGESCSGTDIQGCTGGVAHTYRCGNAGLKCVTAGGTNQCLAAGCTTADVDACGESCSGSKAKICVGGAPYTIECTDYGFTTCSKRTSDKLGTYVVCTN